MDQYELVRRKHFIDGLSRRAVARELGHSRKTIAKAPEHPIPIDHRRSNPVNCPVIDRSAGTVDAWLEEDLQRPRKQRRPARPVITGR